MSEMVKRFVVVKGSQSGHCCFEATVVDMTKPMMVFDEMVGYEAVCECFEVANAEAIARAMNVESPK